MAIDSKGYFQEILSISDAIKDKFDGSSSLTKRFIMGYLAMMFEYEVYVETEPDKSGTFFSVAAAIKRNNGLSYVVTDDEANKNILEKIELDKHAKLVEENDINELSIDMLHICGNDIVRHAQMFDSGYLPLLKEDAIIVFDNIELPEIRKIYNKAKEKYILLLEKDNFGIVIKQDLTQKNLTNAGVLSLKLNKIYNKINDAADTLPTICVALLTYNQEMFIIECLNGIVRQTGNFKIKIVICDDNSTDKTTEIIEQYFADKADVDFVLIKNPQSIGISQNVKQLVYACAGADYIAFCEGDDYWTSIDKLQLQMEFLQQNPQCAICFNSILMYFDKENRYEIYSEQQELQGSIFLTSDLAKGDFIGNLSCCFFDARYIKEIPESLFDKNFIGSWILNIYYSQFGDIGYIRKPMSVYRKHNAGNWGLNSNHENCLRFRQYIDEYNSYLNFQYDAEFTQRKKTLARNDSEYDEKFRIAIVDDVFPHPISGFRYQEFRSYFENIDGVKVFTTGGSLVCLGKASTEELIIDFKRKHPSYANKLEKYSEQDEIYCDLFYFVFLSNAWMYLSLAEEKNIPFVFTLYPGGRFGLNNPQTDSCLSRVVNSPCFKKVIVTQKITYDYLIEKGFCTPGQIEYIFGVVTPLEKLEKEYAGKKHFGFDKDRLDICFVAHKYTEFGEDKGYDVFIEVAKALCANYSNIYFHVVGNFNKDVIDVSAIEERIAFYGTQNQEWFDAFYRDKDIILSPNIPGKIFQGCFDGFPTASCTDAGLRKVAIFCTDLLGLNSGHFKEDEEIVILDYDTAKITAKIAYFYDNPDKLRGICEQGCNRIKEIYGYENQIKSRIDILLEESKIPLSKKSVSKEKSNMPKGAVPPLHAQVYWNDGSGLSEENSVSTTIVDDGLYYTYNLFIPETSGSDILELRLDPINYPAYIDIQELNISFSDDNDFRLSIVPADDKSPKLNLGAGIITINNDDSYKLFCTSNDPYIYISMKRNQKPVLVKIKMKVLPGVEGLQYIEEKMRNMELAGENKGLRMFKGCYTMLKTKIKGM